TNVRLLHVTHPSSARHDTGLYHPERPARLRAVAEGVSRADVDLVEVEALPLPPHELSVVHDAAYVEAIRRLCAAGGGNLDADTHVSRESWEAALAAAGAGPTAAERLAGGFDGPALVGVRPPGHHALPDRAMGFCLFNNVSVTAARLRDVGERVAILDWDVHHGNGTQAMFYSDGDVLYVSLHQSPFYPYEGRASEVGEGAGEGTTLNIPLPAFTAGDVYREAFSRLALPALQAFAPDWLLVSAGFDAHAHDPLAELRLTEGDYAYLGAAIPSVAPVARTILFLEGGYHLPAIRDSVTAVVEALAGIDRGWGVSPYRSPPEAQRALARLETSVKGRVVGLR
ncbi:MAG: histone deacetylase family protein, partial [Actinomycetota bacterium]